MGDGLFLRRPCLQVFDKKEQRAQLTLNCKPEFVDS